MASGRIYRPLPPGNQPHGAKALSGGSRFDQVRSLCELIAEVCDATTKVRLRPLGKQPRHFTLGRNAHSVAQLVVAPVNFPQCWNHGARDGSPTRLGTNRFDQSVFIEAKTAMSVRFRRPSKLPWQRSRLSLSIARPGLAAVPSDTMRPQLGSA
jgi:hypothetical protein